MKKFLLLTVGYTKPIPEIMKSWMQWFKSIEGKIVEQVGLSNGREMTKNGIKELSMDKEAITGYLVINAENIKEALDIANECPMITSTRVYEIRSH